MKTMAKVAIGALMACGVAVAAVGPADAGVRLGIGIGVPYGPAYYGPGYATCYDAYGNPYYCGYPGYYGPAFVGGYWGGGWGHGGWGHGGWGHGGWGHGGHGGWGGHGGGHHH